MTTAPAAEPLVELPALAGPLDTLWDPIVDLERPALGSNPQPRLLICMHAGVDDHQRRP